MSQKLHAVFLDHASLDLGDLDLSPLQACFSAHGEVLGDAVLDLAHRLVEARHVVAGRRVPVLAGDRHLRLAARYLPRETMDKPKQGFSSALPYLLTGVRLAVGTALGFALPTEDAIRKITSCGLATPICEIATNGPPSPVATLTQDSALPDWSTPPAA